LDNQFHLDHDAVLRTVRSAEVIVFRFVTVPQRLLIDFRTSDVDGPMVKLVPRAESAEDRFKSLKMLGPRVRLPEKISAISWPRYVRSMCENGVWDAVVHRIAELGYPAAAAECESIFDELRRMERAEIGHAISGEGYKTLWPAGRRG
jgi:hypothetical protein